MQPSFHSQLPFSVVKRPRHSPGGNPDGRGLTLTLELHPNGITDVVGDTDNDGVRAVLLKPLGFEPMGGKVKGSESRWRHDLSNPPDCYPADPADELRRRCQKDGVTLKEVDRGRMQTRKTSVQDLIAKSSGSGHGSPYQPPSPPPTQTLHRTGRTSIIAAIRSGGQTGADRAALDWALAARMRVCGWVPKGRMAEDGPLSATRYIGLTETGSDDLALRSEWNVRDSDATIWMQTSGPLPAACTHSWRSSAGSTVSRAWC